MRSRRSNPIWGAAIASRSATAGNRVARTQLLRPSAVASALLWLFIHPAAAQTPSFDAPPEVVVILASPSMKSGDAALELPERARRQGIAVRSVVPVTSARSARQAFGGEAWVLELEPGTDVVLTAARL